MTNSIFTNQQVEDVSNFIQKYLRDNDIPSLTADECASLLAKYKILKNDIGPKPGFNFRQMLRDGRDKKIPMVKGTDQKSDRKWIIYRVL